MRRKHKRNYHCSSCNEQKARIYIKFSETLIIKEAEKKLFKVYIFSYAMCANSFALMLSHRRKERSF